MFAEVVRPMPRGTGGRPKKDDESQETRHVRIFRDLADLISDIVDVEGGSVANLLDPMLRAQIQAKHAAIKPQIDQINRARQAAQRKKPGA